MSVTAEANSRKLRRWSFLTTRDVLLGLVFLLVGRDSAAKNFYREKSRRLPNKLS